MSDFISRSALIELIQKDIEKTASFMNTAEKYDGSFDKLYGQLNTLRNYKSIISDIPTAYDVEKVVAELEEEKDIAYADFEKYANDYFLDLDEDVDDWYYKGLERAINVIRKGGVE